MRRSLAFLGIWGAILVWRWEVIALPPYYDQATGFFVEANYLVENDFDYATLSDQPRWTAGGPAVYLISISPTLLALLMKVAPNSEFVLVTFHLFNFACAAAIAMLVYTLVLPYAGRLGASLTAAVLLTVPTFNVQIDMLGIDLPVAALALACALLLRNQFYSWAVFCSALAFAVKASGRAVSLGVLIYLVMVLITVAPWESKEFRRRLAIALMLSVAVFLSQAVATHWLDTRPGSAAENWAGIVEANNAATLGDDTVLSVGLRHLGHTWDWFPEQVAVFAGSAMGSLVLGGWYLTKNRCQSNEPVLVRLGKSIGKFLSERGPLVFAWILMLGSLAAFTQTYCLPRYFSLLFPFLYVVFGTLLFITCRSRALAMAVCIVLCTFNLLNMQGAFMPEFNTYGRTGAVLERSREYLSEHRSNVEAIKLIAQHYAELPIIAGRPYVECLALPRLGYVDNPLGGYSVNEVDLASFSDLMQVLTDLPSEVVVISVVNALTPPGLIPSPADGDVVLYNDHHDSPLVVFKRSWNADLLVDQLRNGYQAMLWPNEYFSKEAEELFTSRHYEEAERRCREVLSQHPYSASAMLVLAAIHDRRGEYSEARALLGNVVRKSPSHIPAHKLMASVCMKEKDYEGAIDHLRIIVTLDPDNGASARRLGELLLGEGCERQAIKVFLERLEREPDDALAHVRLAQAYEATRQTTAAIAHYKLALELRPDSPEAANNLAWLRATHPDDSLRHGDEALRYAQVACELTGHKDPSYLGTLSAAYAECEQFDKAITTARQAIRLANEAGAVAAAERIEGRLVGFRSQQPYRQSW